ncbi:MAG: outer membrane beta-barrel protein [Gammaproteobacteria bacterium]
MSWLLLRLVAAILTLVMLGSAMARADTLTLPTAVPIDGGPLGELKVQGMLSGLAATQSNATSSDLSQRFDVDNAELILQKYSGEVQFLVQGGAYNFPVVGEPFTDTPDLVNNLYGPVPLAYIKFVPTDSISLQVGKLPSLVGAEGAWPWGNYNIERGLLWNMENTVTRGVQFNYSKGVISASLAWTDGFYSHRFNNLTGSLTYTLSTADTLTAVVYDTLGNTPYGSSATPEVLNNARIYNLIYTHSTGSWTFTPYIQYIDSSASAELGYTHDNSSFGAALLTDYAVNRLWSLGARVEYVTSSGADNTSANNNLLGYGPGSRAWTLTFTPTWQSGGLFARIELSYARVVGYTPGLAFGRSGNQADQMRLLLETGVVF